MLMRRIVMCLILAMLQPGFVASEVYEELRLLQQQFVQMQQHMQTTEQQMGIERQEMQRQRAIDRQEMHKSREATDDVQLLKQQLKAIQQHMTTERDEMKQQQHRMQQKMHNLEKENTKLEQNVNNINGKLANVVHENQQLSEIVNVLKQDSADLSLGFQNVSDVVSQAVGSKHNGSFIGFSAYASESRDYNDGVPVLFDSVITNVGSMYSPGPSVFLCGYQGYYLFSLNVRTLTGDDMLAELIMNGTSIAAVYADQAEHDATSNMVVVQCPQFSQVYVRAIGDGNTMHGSSTSFHSTFTGILLAQQ